MNAWFSQAAAGLTAIGLVVSNAAFAAGPASTLDGSIVVSAPPPPIRASPALDQMTVLFDGRTLAGWDYNQDWHVCEILAKLSTGEVRAAVDGVEITKYKHPDPSVLLRGPIGMQIHSSVGIFDYKDIRIEVDPKEDRLITVK